MIIMELLQTLLKQLKLNQIVLGDISRAIVKSTLGDKQGALFDINKAIEFEKILMNIQTYIH